jgi:hypothetical protein
MTGFNSCASKNTHKCLTIEEEIERPTKEKLIL